MRQAPHGERMKRAAHILDRYPLIDGHNDLPWQFRTLRKDQVFSQSAPNLTEGWSQVHTDIVKIRAGHLGAQFWVAYVDCNSSYKDAIRQNNGSDRRRQEDGASLPAHSGVGHYCARY
ncbi:hypothetical protein ACOMHN_059045 [Nucella lapillus]